MPFSRHRSRISDSSEGFIGFPEETIYFKQANRCCCGSPFRLICAAWPKRPMRSSIYSLNYFRKLVFGIVAYTLLMTLVVCYYKVLMDFLICDLLAARNRIFYGSAVLL
jgi:hypothetical protein